MERISESDVIIQENLYLIRDKVEVYKVKHIRTGKTYCMKKIFIENLHHFHQTYFEFLNLASINHENIMCLRSVEMPLTPQNVVSFVCIYTDFYEEGDLGKYIRSRRAQNSPFSEAELLHITASLIDTFAFLQSKNLAHRDIKPENIFIKDQASKFIIGDFGSSKLKNDSSGQTLVGTPLYLSPRLRNNYDHNDYQVDHDIFKSDAYSFGMTILHMATFCDMKKIFNSNQRTKDLGNLIKTVKSRIIQEVLTKMLHEDERKRFDFLQIQEFLNSFHSFTCEICGKIDLNPRIYEDGAICEKCYYLTEEILNSQGRDDVVKKNHGSVYCNGIQRDRTCTCGLDVCLYCKNLAHAGVSCLQATKRKDYRENYIYNSKFQVYLPEGSYFLENDQNFQICVVCSEFFNNDSHERCVFFFTNVEIFN